MTGLVNKAGITIVDIYWNNGSFDLPEHWCVQIDDGTGRVETHGYFETYDDAKEFALSYGSGGELLGVKL